MPIGLHFFEHLTSWTSQRGVLAAWKVAKRGHGLYGSTREVLKNGLFDANRGLIRAKTGFYRPVGTFQATILGVEFRDIRDRDREQKGHPAEGCRIPPARAKTRPVRCSLFPVPCSSLSHRHDELAEVAAFFHALEDIASLGPVELFADGAELSEP